MKSIRESLRPVIALVSVTVAAAVLFLILGRMGTGLRLAGSDAGNPAMLGSVVVVAQALRVELNDPPQWEAVTNARLDEFTPRPVLLLVHKELPALVRFILRPSAEGTPAEIARQFTGQFAAAGTEWSLVCDPEASGGRCSLVFETTGSQPPVKGKIWIERLSGDAAARILVVIGVWTPGLHDRLEPEIDHLADHAKAAD